MNYELDRLELGPRPALAIQYSADVQRRMWYSNFDWRVHKPLPWPDIDWSSTP